MKRFLAFLMILFAVFALPIAALAQTAETLTEAVSTVFDPTVLFASLSALVTAVTVVTQFVKSKIKSEGFWTKLLSWAVAAGLSVCGWFLHLGIFEGVAWYWMLCYALASGLVANSIFDLGIVTGIINLFKSKQNVS